MAGGCAVSRRGKGKCGKRMCETESAGCAESGDAGSAAVGRQSLAGAKSECGKRLSRLHSMLLALHCCLKSLTHPRLPLIPLAHPLIPLYPVFPSRVLLASVFTASVSRTSRAKTSAYCSPREGLPSRRGSSFAEFPRAACNPFY